MLMTRIMDDFESASQVRYWELLRYMKEHELNKRHQYLWKSKKALKENPM